MAKFAVSLIWRPAWFAKAVACVEERGVSGDEGWAALLVLHTHLNADLVGGLLELGKVLIHVGDA